MIKTIALQNANLNRANFSTVAADPIGVIQLLEGCSERMLGSPMNQIVDRLNPRDLHALIGHIPIIALSASAGPRDIPRVPEVHFFHKPTKAIEVRELLSTLVRALKTGIPQATRPANLKVAL